MCPLKPSSICMNEGEDLARLASLLSKIHFACLQLETSSLGTMAFSLTTINDRNFVYSKSFTPSPWTNLYFDCHRSDLRGWELTIWLRVYIHCSSIRCCEQAFTDKLSQYSSFHYRRFTCCCWCYCSSIAMLLRLIVVVTTRIYVCVVWCGGVSGVVWWLLQHTTPSIPGGVVVAGGGVRSPPIRPDRRMASSPRILSADRTAHTSRGRFHGERRV